MFDIVKLEEEISSYAVNVIRYWLFKAGALPPPVSVNTD